jgi:hypothetical protein
MNPASLSVDPTLGSSAPTPAAEPPAPPPAMPNRLIDTPLNDVARAAVLAREVRRFEAMKAGAECDACAKAFRAANPEATEPTAKDLACIGYPPEDHDGAEVFAFITLHWPETHETRRPGGNGARLALAASMKVTRHFEPDPEPEVVAASAADVACEEPLVGSTSAEVPVSSDLQGSSGDVDITGDLEEALAATGPDGEEEVEEVMPKDAGAFDYLSWEPGRAASFKAEWVRAYAGHTPTPEQEAAWAKYAEEEIAYVVTRVPEIEAAWRSAGANAGKLVTEDDQSRWGMKALEEFQEAHPREELVPETPAEHVEDAHEEIADEEALASGEGDLPAAEVAATEEPPPPVVEGQTADPAKDGAHQELVDALPPVPAPAAPPGEGNGTGSGEGHSS